MRFLLLVATGCIANEAAIGRHGLVHGSAERGGIGISALSSTYRETGTQNVAAGLSLNLLEQGDKGELIGTLGVGARYAHQLGDARAWRGFTRASLGLAACQISSCADPMAAMHHGYSVEAQLGVERLVLAPDLDRPQQSSSISVELGVAYTHGSDSVVGQGDFIGVALGMRVGVDLAGGK